jgi:hypothetical protein
MFKSGFVAKIDQTVDNKNRSGPTQSRCINKRGLGGLDTFLKKSADPFGVIKV